VSENAASASATPEPASVAVHRIATLSACQAPSAEPHVTAGASVSSPPVGRARAKGENESTSRHTTVLVVRVVSRISGVPATQCTIDGGVSV
jgi:hypothetical protein